MNKNQVVSAGKTENVRVAIRVRPLNKTEKDRRDISVVDVNYNTNQGPPSSVEPRTFTFDQVYDVRSSQKEVYEKSSQDIIESVLDGYHGTIFAYGQTGTGKTYTMEGIDHLDEDLRGIIPNCFYHIFDYIRNNTATNMEFMINVTMLEIYLEEVYDLFNNRKKLEIHEHPEKGVFVKNIYQIRVKSASELINLLKTGVSNRASAATAMNQNSSRSHSVFTINIDSCEHDETNKQETHRSGRMNLVDLAGSERQEKTKATGERLEEAKKINLSLSNLGNCIKALINPKVTHIPYRDSKLTRILQDSLGGNSKTLMIANLGPSFLNYQETLTTLKYADRAKQIKNKPRINEDPKDSMLRSYMEELKALEIELQKRKKGLSSNINATDDLRRKIKQNQDPIIKETIRKEIIVKVDGVSKEELEQKTKLFEETHNTEKMKIIHDTHQFVQLSQEKQDIINKIEDDIKNKENSLNEEDQKIQELEKLLANKANECLRGTLDIEEAIRRREEIEKLNSTIDAKNNAIQNLVKQIDDFKDAEKVMQNHYVNKKQELEKKTETLKIIYKKYQEKLQEYQEMQTEEEETRTELLEVLRNMQKEKKLLDLLIDTFIPREYFDLITSHSYYDEINEIWHIKNSQYCGFRQKENDETTIKPYLSSNHSVDLLSDSNRFSYEAYIKENTKTRRK